MADVKLGTIYYDYEVRYKGIVGGNGAPMGGGGGLPSAQNISAPAVGGGGRRRGPTFNPAITYLEDDGSSTMLVNGMSGTNITAPSVGGRAAAGSSYRGGLGVGMSLYFSGMFGAAELGHMQAALGHADIMAANAGSLSAYNSAMLQRSRAAFGGMTGGMAELLLNSTNGFGGLTRTPMGDEARFAAANTAISSRDYAAQAAGEMGVAASRRDAWYGAQGAPSQLRSVLQQGAGAAAKIAAQKDAVLREIGDLQKIVDAIKPEESTFTPSKFGGGTVTRTYSAAQQTTINAHRSKIQTLTAQYQGLNEDMVFAAEQQRVGANDAMTRFFDAGRDRGQANYEGMATTLAGYRSRMIARDEANAMAGLPLDPMTRMRARERSFARNNNMLLSENVAELRLMESEREAFSRRVQGNLASQETAYRNDFDLRQIGIDAGLKASEAAYSSRAAAGVITSVGSIRQQATALMQADALNNRGQAKDVLQTGINNLLALQRQSLANGRAVATDNPFAVDFSGTSTPREDSTRYLQSIDQGIKDLKMAIDAL